MHAIIYLNTSFDFISNDFIINSRDWKLVMDLSRIILNVTWFVFVIMTIDDLMIILEFMIWLSKTFVYCYLCL